MVRTEKIKEYDKIYYQKNKEKLKEAQRKWQNENKEKYLKFQKKWREENKEKLNEEKRKWQKEYRKRNKNIIQAYKKSEKIKIPKNQKCENCKKELAIHKHHEDYSKPLNIKFLCLSCHRQLHKDRRAN